MKPRLLCLLGIVTLALALVQADMMLRAETPTKSGKKSKKKQVDEAEVAKHRVSLEVARDRAKQMHETMESTLHVMHRHYFHRERATVPARALEDVFEDVERNSRVNLRWISVNTKAMSVDHEPESDFEKKAAREIASGKEFYEEVENGTYRRAGAILLGSGCVHCHTTSFAPPPKTPRFAALVINVPTKGATQQELLKDRPTSK